MSFGINSYLLALQAYCFSHLYAIMLVVWHSKVTFRDIIFGKTVDILKNSELYLSLYAQYAVLLSTWQGYIIPSATVEICQG
jgi:hypothetical protein